MKIVVVGSFLHPMYARAVYDAFLKQGFKTYAFDWEEHKIKGNKLYNFISRVEERLLIGPFISRTNARLLKLVEDVKPDLVFIYRGTHIKSTTVSALKEKGIIVFSYHNDDPFCGVPSKRYMRNYIKSAYFCDFNFVYRHKNIDDFANIGIHNVDILRSYYIKENNFYIDCEKIYDLVFAGHFENDGRDRYIKSLKDAGLNVLVFGDAAWTKSLIYQELKQIIKKDKRGLAYNKLLNQTKIALVFLSKTNSDTYTRRCFEIPATKTLMLCEYTDDMASMFEMDKEAVYFSSASELIEKCKYLLNNPDMIKEIGDNGYNRLMKDGHLIDDRIDEIIKKFNRLKKK
ncbi:MAG TPA: glycosyltransferase [Lutibacter sp.]